MGTMKTVSFQPSVGTKRTRPQHWGNKKKEIQISYERFPKEQENKSLVNNFFKPLKQTFFSDAVSQWHVNDLFIRTFYISNREEVGGFHTEFFL